LAYHHTLANYLMLMHWIDERRIEMHAEGRRHWVPSVRDFEQAMRDCRDDLVREPSYGTDLGAWDSCVVACAEAES
jgi:hypothetical protein